MEERNRQTNENSRLGLTEYVYDQNANVQHRPRFLATTYTELFFNMALNEPNDLKGPENITFTIRMYGETFYGRHGKTLAAVMII